LFLLCYASDKRNVYAMQERQKSHRGYREKDRKAASYALDHNA
jgi:hypothetical protein